MEDKKKIDELFGKRFGDFEAEPPADAWSNIEDRLDRKDRRKRIGYWRMAGTAAAVVLAFFTGYFFNPESDPGQELRETGRPSQEIWNRVSDEQQEEKTGNRVAEDESALEQEETTGNNAPTQAPRKEKSKKQEKAKSSGNGPGRIESPFSVRENMPIVEAPAKEPQPVDTDREILDPDFMLPVEEESIAGEFGDGKVKNQQVRLEKTRNAQRAQTNLLDEESSVDNAGDQPQQAATSDIAAMEKPVVKDSLHMNSEAENADMAVLNESHQNLLTNDELGKKSKIVSREGMSLGLMASPTFAFRNVNIDQSMASAEYLQENVDNENIVNSYTAGVDFAYRNSSKLELQAGLYLNNWEQRSDQVVLQADKTNSPTAPATSGERAVVGNTSTSYLNFGNSGQNEDLAIIPGEDSSMVADAYRLVPGVEQRYQFIEIPLSVGYYLLENNKWGWKIRGGVTPRIIANSNANLTYSDGREQSVEESGLNKLTLQFLAGTGVEYRLNKHLRINLSPSIQYGMTPINRNDQVNTYFHQALIYSGLSYKF